jgi:Ca2+-binding RTX toxin-like protein
MANIVLGSIGSAGFHFDNFENYDFFEFDKYDKLKTYGVDGKDGLRVYADSKNYTEVRGDDLSYVTEHGEIMGLESGTLTSLTQVTSGTKLFVGTGFKITADQFNAIGDGEDISKAVATILSGNDKITGSKFADTIYGGKGNDTLKGGAGNDVLKGDAGNDTLYGGLGKDVLTGGAGKDTFVFDTKLGATNVDTITDFSVKDDRIVLDDDIFKKIGKVGDLSAAAFHIGTKAHDASDRIIYDNKSGKLWYDADGNGKGAAVQFATLDHGLKLTAAHFDIIA